MSADSLRLTVGKEENTRYRVRDNDRHIIAAAEPAGILLERSCLPQGQRMYVGSLHSSMTLTTNDEAIFIRLKGLPAETRRSGIQVRNPEAKLVGVAPIGKAFIFVRNPGEQYTVEALR